MGFYAPQTMLREGNVFRNLYYSVLGGDGACMAGGAWLEPRKHPYPCTVGKRKVPILLECCLVYNILWRSWIQQGMAVVGGGGQIYLRSTNQAENESHLKDIKRNVESPNWYSFDIAKGSVLHVLVLSSLLPLFRGLSIGLCEAFCIIISKVYYFARCPLLRSSGNKWTSEF